jgi:Ala-tRNA(Pro) deacylase
MTVSRRLKEYLDENEVEYSVMTHEAAFTAQQVAAAQGVTGWRVAKSVILHCDGEYLLVVLQAPARVDFDRIREILACEDVRLATESEMEKLFPGVEIGAESPFGNLYNIPVYVDRGLTDAPEIVFNAGTHVETIQIKYTDFDRLVQPRVVDISRSVGV